MTIRKIQSHQLSRSVAQKLTQATFIGSVDFAQVWRAIGGRDVYWLVEVNDRTVAAMAAVEFGGRVTRRMQCMPDGLYARPVLLERIDNANAVRSQLLDKLGKAAYVRVIVNDFEGSFGEAPGFRAQDCETSLIDISAPDWQPPDKKLQSEIRKAEREGVTVEEFSLNRHMDMFLELMRHTESRHGRSPRYTDGFYRELARLAARDMRVRWRVVEYEGELAASHIYFVERDMLLHWQASYDKRFSHLKPNQLIMYTTARELARKGVRTLNLGSSPPEADGLVEYKEKWGGSTRRYRSLNRQSILGRMFR
jgi:hypothetical protein